MVRIAAIEVVLNSSWVIEKKPTVSRQIVHRGDDRADRELPFEAEPQIGQHRHDRQHDAERARIAPVRPKRAGRPLRRGGNRRIAERLLDLVDRRLLRRVAAGLHAEAHRDVGGRAEPLHFDVAEAEMIGEVADIGEIGGARLGPHLHQRAAGKIDAEIHADGQEQHDRDDRQHGRERIAHAPEAHEGEFGVFGREAQQLHVNYSPRELPSHQIGSLVGRSYRYHSAIIMRVMVTAVTMVVRMPSASETAKPRTGPEPRK